jgi:photosystem II stability/assembly factor-like uncharacterized protein
MSRIILLIVSLIIVEYSYGQSRIWQKLGGPYGAFIESFYTTDDNTYYVSALLGTERHIMSSTDKGATWKDLPKLPSGLKEFFLRTSPASYYFAVDADNNLFINFGDNINTFHLYLSTDRGNTWNLAADSIYNIYLSNRPGEYYFQKLSSSYYVMYRQYILSSNRDTVEPTAYVWLQDSLYTSRTQRSGGIGLPLTTNNGKTWGAYTLPFRKQYDRTIWDVVRLNNDVIAVLDQDSMYQSRIHIGKINGSWTKVIKKVDYNITKIFNLPSGRFIGLTDTRNDFRVFISDGDSLVTPLRLPETGDPYLVAKENPIFVDKNGVIFYCLSDAVYRSDDEGGTWKSISFTASDNVHSIHIDNRGRIVTKNRAIFSNGYYAEYPTYADISTDSGKTWSAASPVTKRTLGYVGPGYDGGIILTTKDSIRGQGMDLWYLENTEDISWKNLSRVYYPPANASGGPSIADFILVDKDNNVYLGAESNLYKSEDRCRNWDYLQSPPLTSAKIGCISPSGKLYVGGKGNRLSSTTDGGKTWEFVGRLPYLPDGNPIGIVSPKEKLLFVISDKYGLFRSEDDGANWENISGPWGDSLSCITATKNNEVFIGTATRGLFSCDHQGKNAKREPIDIPSNNILSLYTHQGMDVYVGTMGSSLWMSKGNDVPTESAARDADYQAELIRTGSGYEIRMVNAVPKRIDVSIYDLLGRQIQSKNVNVSGGTYIIPIDLASQSDGTYYIRLTSTTGSHILKTVK